MLSSLGITATKDDVCFSCAYAYAYVAVCSSEDNIRKINVFVLLMLRCYVHAYALVRASLNSCIKNPL